MKLHFLPRYSLFRNLPCSTASHLMVESDRISVTLITCGIAQTIALDILNGYRIGHTTGRPYKTKFYCVYGKMFFIIESLFNSKRGWVVSKCKSSSKCAINSNTSELFVSPTFFFSTSILSLMMYIVRWYVIRWHYSQLNMWQNIWTAVTSWDSFWVVIWSQKTNLLENISIFQQLLFDFEVSRFGKYSYLFKLKD